MSPLKGSMLASANSLLDEAAHQHESSPGLSCTFSRKC